jgi:hypothetical protein
MTDFANIVTRTAEEIAAHREASIRLRTAVVKAQERHQTPSLEAVFMNDGILVAIFYGIRPGCQNIRFGTIYGQFDYDEMEEAIEFVDKL